MKWTDVDTLVVVIYILAHQGSIEDDNFVEEASEFQCMPAMQDMIVPLMHVLCSRVSYTQHGPNSKREGRGRICMHVVSHEIITTSVLSPVHFITRHLVILKIRSDSVDKEKNDQKQCKLKERNNSLWRRF